MQVVVVLAHPDPDSFHHVIAAHLSEALRAKGHDVVLHDLHAEGFVAAMSAAERGAYHGAEPVLDAQVAAHVADIRSAHALIFVYPTRWSTLPPILKGWLERVMVPGVGFVFDAEHRVRPGLTNVRRIVGISTYDSPWWRVRAVNDNGRRTITRALRLSTGLRTRTQWLTMYQAHLSTSTRQTAFLGSVTSLAQRL